MKNSQLFFASTTLCAACAVLWSVARPLADTVPAIKVIGFNLSAPALATGFSIIIGFTALFGAMLATKNAFAARRDRAEFGPTKLAIRR